LILWNLLIFFITPPGDFPDDIKIPIETSEKTISYKVFSRRALKSADQIPVNAGIFCFPKRL